MKKRLAFKHKRRARRVSRRRSGAGKKRSAPRPGGADILLMLALCAILALAGALLYLHYAKGLNF